MSTLRVIVDDALDPGAGDAGRYAEELARAIVATRPPGADVAGFVAASSAEDARRLGERLPGLAVLHRSALTRGQLAAAWRRGLAALPGHGMVHATSLLAPLRRHDRTAVPGSQIAVTISDATAWTDPELLPSGVVSWTRAMARRAERHADAIVVPTHATADALAEHLDLGDRVRVIGGAPSTRLAPVEDAAARRERLGIPRRYVLTVADGSARSGVAELMEAVGRLDGVALVVAGATAAREDLLAAGGRAAASVIVPDALDDADLAAIHQGAAAYAQPSLAEGLGLAMLDAFAFGLPVVHTDVPALDEIAAGAGLAVPRDDPAGLSDRLAEALHHVLDDDGAAGRLGVAGQDRARAFSWRDAAERVWQLHADL